MTLKVAILIPTTSKKRDSWKTMKDTYLYKTIKSFLQSVSTNDANQYTFFLGYDIDDRIFSIEKQQAILNKFQKVFKQITITWISLSGIEKGHLTKMWNRLFRNAFNVGNDSFYQCGDDIDFCTKGWVESTIQMLQIHNNIGISGPINNNNRILTQAMVSRKHMEIFGFFFPESIINWCCDDWYNWVYQPNYFYPIKEHFCANIGGQPRYIINNNRNFNTSDLSLMKNTRLLRESTYALAKEHSKIIKDYVDKQINDTDRQYVI